MKPSINIRRMDFATKVDGDIRALSTYELLRQSEHRRKNPRQEQFQNEILVRIEMANAFRNSESLDTLAPDDLLPLLDAPSCHLYIRLWKPSPPDDHQRECFGENLIDVHDDPRWYVGCIRPKLGGGGVLPLAFAHCEEVKAALSELVSAKLATYDALYTRIKTQRDWPGVKRIMLGQTSE